MHNLGFMAIDRLAGDNSITKEDKIPTLCETFLAKGIQETEYV
jgi:peptidyl-tRNA hydrolase